jgi:hypothetical protein
MVVPYLFYKIKIMAKILAIYNDSIENTDIQVDVNGFIIMTNKEMEDYEEIASSITWPFTYKFNELELEFTNGEDLLTRIDFREISNEEAKTFKRLFNDEFGIFISEDELHTIIGDEEDLDEESDDDDYYDEENEDY